jgi:hypothetical protein
MKKGMRGPPWEGSFFFKLKKYMSKNIGCLILIV